MAVLTTLAAFTLVSVVGGSIYPDGHFDYVTKMTENTFEDVVKEQVDLGKTLFVRWIASEG